MDLLERYWSTICVGPVAWIGAHQGEHLEKSTSSSPHDLLSLVSLLSTPSWSSHNETQITPDRRREDGCSNISMVQMRTAAIARACRAPDDDLGLFTSESIAAERIFAWKSPELKTPSLVELARALLYGIPLGSRVMDGLRSNKDGVECLREEASYVPTRVFPNS